MIIGTIMAVFMLVVARHYNSPYMYKEVSVTICKDMQSNNCTKNGQNCYVFVNLKHNINMSINFLKFFKISAKNASQSVRTCNMSSKFINLMQSITSFKSEKAYNYTP